MPSHRSSITTNFSSSHPSVRSGRSWRQAVEVAERFADGQASLDEVRAARASATRARSLGAGPCAVASVTDPLSHLAVTWWHWRRRYHGVEAVCRTHAHLLRHVFGNPLAAASPPVELPSGVVRLAEAVYAGQECVFALHDALLEAGQAELAAHFGEAEQHPRGCAALDGILGKS